jgi:hypothetical protein
MYRRNITSCFYGSALSLYWMAGLLCFFFALRLVYAQSTYGSVIGVVEDANRAAVAGARVTLAEVQTNVTRAIFDSAGKPIFIGRFGNAGYGSIEGPGIVGVDFGAFKEFNIREGIKLRLQTQVKNLPNHPNLGNPETSLSSGNYGKIRSLNPNFGLREVLLGAWLTF